VGSHYCRLQLYYFALLCNNIFKFRKSLKISLIKPKYISTSAEENCTFIEIKVINFQNLFLHLSNSDTNDFRFFVCGLGTLQYLTYHTIFERNREKKTSAGGVSERDIIGNL